MISAATVAEKALRALLVDPPDYERLDENVSILAEEELEQVQNSARRLAVRCGEELKRRRFLREQRERRSAA